MFSFRNAQKRRNKAARINSVLPLEQRILPSAVQVTSTLENDGSVNLSFVGTEAEEFLAIAPGGPGEIIVVGAQMSLNGGPETDILIFSALNDLRFDLGGGFDGFTMLDIAVNDIEIIDGATPFEGSFYSISSLYAPMTVGDIDAEFNGGFMTLSLTSDLDLTVQDVNVEANGGSSVNVRMTANGNGQITVDGDLEFDAASASAASFFAQTDTFFGSASSILIDGNLELELGGGSDSVRIAGTVSVDREVSIETGAGDDFVQVVPGFYVPTQTVSFGRSVTIETGEGQDWVQLIAQATPNRISVGKDLTIETGDQNDIIQMFGVVIDKKMKLDTGNSDAAPGPFGPADVVSLGNTEIFGKSEVNSAGLANVYLFAVNSALQPARFHGSAEFTLGSGFVDASFVFDPASQVIFGSHQKYTGLNSTITVSYGSNVVFNLNKRKLFNAIVI